MHLASAAVGAALELKIFWFLDEEPMNAKKISAKLKIPYDRTYSWLELLVGLGFLNREHDRYIPSSITQSTIINTFKPDSWAFLALEARDRYTLGTNLSSNIFLPHSIWNDLPESPPNWFKKINSDMDYCRRFTRMLYDLHQNLALNLAEIIDLSDKTKLMDLGGGSGVISLSLLRKNSELTAVVVDIPSVCQIGKEIVKENEMSHRLTYYPANFVTDDIPSGFDVIIECDVGIYTESLFQKIFTSLNPNGEFIIVANIDADSARILRPDLSKPLPLLLNTFQSSLETHKLSESTIDEILHLLSETGFSIIPQDESIERMTLIRAKKGK
jgi:SAM-dependent methyltransferase